MNENNITSPKQLPSGTPKWVLIVSVLVGSALIPAFMALSPHISELIKGATEARKAQAENERTALGTVLELVNTNVKQVYVLSAALEVEQAEKRTLTARVSELEKSDMMRGKQLLDCESQLKICKIK